MTFKEIKDEMTELTREVFFFILGAGMDSAKEKPFKGRVFFLFFLLAFLIVIYLVVRIFI